MGDMSSSNQPDQPDQPDQHVTTGHPDPRVVVVTPDGLAVAGAESSATSATPLDDRTTKDPTDLVEQPAKVMRIGTMVKQLLEEVRSAPLDDAGRARLAAIHQRSVAELKDGLASELVEELDRLALPFSGDAPSDAELRIAQAQLVGWLEGLFHGIQTALFAQQMAAQQQLQGMRRALPPGHPDEAGPTPSPTGELGPTGQYL